MRDFLGILLFEQKLHKIHIKLLVNTNDLEETNMHLCMVAASNYMPINQVSQWILKSGVPKAIFE